METPLKTSPLNQEHLDLEAKMVPFAGWSMPVFYDGIVPEHLAVRSSVGVFDISHMGECYVTGSGAKDWLNRLLSNQIDKLKIGDGQYTMMLNERGGVLDDLYVYRTEENSYFLVINASRIDEDIQWLEINRTGNVTISDVSSEFGGLAVQGPDAVALAEKLAGPGETLPERNGILQWHSPSGQAGLGRTGYTGEDGFEIFFPKRDASHWWRRILELGAKPCGLGARDSLRLEMGYPLYGNDLNIDRTPLEAGLGFFVDLKKDDLLGIDVLRNQKEIGVPARLTAFKMMGKSPPPRADYGIFDGEAEIGKVCSGAQSPSLKCGIGMAYLPLIFAKFGSTYELDIRGRRFKAETVKKPFYKHP